MFSLSQHSTDGLKNSFKYIKVRSIVFMTPNGIAVFILNFGIRADVLYSMGVVGLVMNFHK